jgi:membrane protein implicated in regulation of membrane protease activity
VRNSDRWVTPGVIVAVILTAGTVVLGIAAGLVYLAALGRDPDPVLRFVVELTGTVAILLNVGMTLAGRATTAKVERNTGVLANRTGALADEVGQLVSDTGRHHYPDTMAAPAVPPVPCPR